jgi:hypothetical protein
MEQGENRMINKKLPTRKEIADRVRLEVLAMSDNDLCDLSTEAFSDGFKTVPEFLIELTTKSRESQPF